MILVVRNDLLGYFQFGLTQWPGSIIRMAGGRKPLAELIRMSLHRMAAATTASVINGIKQAVCVFLALNASETGLMIYSTMHTISAGQSINRILGMFSKEEEHQMRERLAGSLRYVIGQRLVPQKTGGRLLVTEVMGHNLRTHEAIAQGENESRRLSEIIESGKHAGWHSFEQSLLKAYEQDLITEDTAMLYSTNKPTMRQMLDISRGRSHYKPIKSQVSPMIVVPPRAPINPAPVRRPAEPDNLSKPGLV